MSTVPGAGTYQPVKPRGLDGGAQQPEAGGGGIAERAAPVGAGGTPAQPGAAPATLAAQPVLDPSRIKDRIDTLIDGQVATGRLTRDQAGVLRQVLRANDRSDAVPDNGSPEAPSPDGEASGSGSGSGAVAGVEASSAAPAPVAGDARPSPSETLASFIQQLQSGQSRTVGYGSDGSRGTNLTSSRLLDFNT